ncbi:MAG: aldo/keto reductase [Propioniciclava sp.]
MRTLTITTPGGPLTVSRLVLGTDYFGSGVPRDEAFAILDAYLAAGGTTVDTARCYAAWMPGGAGASEATIGAWLESRNARAQMILSTKGGHPHLETRHVPRLDASSLRVDLEASCDALRTGRVDLYWLHRDDPDQAPESVIDTLAEVFSTGRVRAYGCSNWPPERIRRANAHAERQGTPGFVASQVQWSLATSTARAQQDATRWVMDAAGEAAYRASGMPVFAYTAQAKGFFARPLHGRGAMNAKARAWFGNEVNLLRRQRVRAYAERTGRSVSAVVLGWLTSQPVPTAALIGPRSLPQLQESLAAADLRLPSADLAWLTATGY